MVICQYYDVRWLDIKRKQNDCVVCVGHILGVRCPDVPYLNTGQCGAAGLPSNEIELRVPH